MSCAEVAGDDPAALDDIGVVRGALGHEAVLDHPGVVGAGLLGHHLAHRRVEQLHRLDVAPPPADVGDRDDLDAGLRGGLSARPGFDWVNSTTVGGVSPSG
jgi:hypothetical protein